MFIVEFELVIFGLLDNCNVYVIIGMCFIDYRSCLKSMFDMY